MKSEVSLQRNERNGNQTNYMQQAKEKVPKTYFIYSKILLRIKPDVKKMGQNNLSFPSWLLNCMVLDSRSQNSGLCHQPLRSVRARDASVANHRTKSPSPWVAVGYLFQEKPNLGKISVPITDRAFTFRIVWFLQNWFANIDFAHTFFVGWAFPL